MTRTAVVALAIGYLGVFLLSAAAGGLIARQMHATPDIAVASPTPTFTAVATIEPTPSPPPASPPPASLQPTVPVVSTAPMTPTPSIEPSPTLEPTATLNPPTVEQFTHDLAAALRDGDFAYLVTHLHPVTIGRYGEQVCTHYAQGIPSTDPKWEVLSVSGPAPWTYTTDGIDTVIPDAWTVSVRQPGANPELRELHFAPSDGTWRWFTDCGTPQ